MELKQAEKIAKALADENRLRILRHLQAQGGRMECMEIAGILDLAQPSISHHVKKLVEAGLIVPRKEGRYYHYSLDRKVWKDFLFTLGHLSEAE